MTDAPILEPDPWLENALASAGWSSRAVDARRAALLSDGRGFTGTVHRLDAPDAPTVILKQVPDPDRRERAVREIAFLRHLDAIDPERRLHAPRLLAATDDGDVRLLLEPVDGVPGDVCGDPTVAELDAVIDAIVVLHQLPVDHAAPPPWLPRWGVGQVDTDRPHRRRAERYAKRLPPFLAWWGDACPPAFVDLCAAIEPDAESILARAAAVRPRVLIHADMHLDNVIFAPDGHAVLLDWQSVSLGPAAYDVARLLVESVDEPDDGARLVERARRALGAPASFADDVRTILLAVVIGFVCGYGGRDPARAHPRERRMVRIALGRRLGRIAPEWAGGVD